jgi:hypothetical protein
MEPIREQLYEIFNSPAICSSIVEYAFDKSDVIINNTYIDNINNIRNFDYHFGYSQHNVHVTSIEFITPTEITTDMLDNFIVCTTWINIIINTPVQFTRSLKKIHATIGPDLTSTASMFSGCNNNFENNMRYWDMSRITRMSSMFANAIEFNGEIGDWDVSNVVYMDSMFYNAKKFNRHLNWDVSSVRTMFNMFGGAHSFEGSGVPEWDVKCSTNKLFMFYRTDSLISWGGWITMRPNAY